MKNTTSFHSKRKQFRGNKKIFLDPYECDYDFLKPFIKRKFFEVTHIEKNHSQGIANFHSSL